MATLFRAVVCVLTLTAYVSAYTEPENKWLSSSNPLDIPLEIHVSLLGKGNVRAEDLQVLLAAHLPKYRVSDIESHEMSQVQFALSYQVEQTNAEKAKEYERLLAAAIRTSERSASDGLVYVNTDSLVQFFGRLHVESMRTVKREDQFYSVFIVTPDHSALGLFGSDKKDHGYVYATGHGRKLGSGIWIGPGRWIVVDLSAAPVEFGSSEGSSAFTSSSLPYFDPAHPQLQTLLAPAETQLAVLISNAVKNVFASDVKFHLLRDESKIVVPIVLLRNHDMFDPFKEKGHEYSIDVEAIRNEISPLLLPSQRLEIVTASHSLHEHKTVSMAVFKSLKTVAEFRRNENGLYDIFKSTHVDSAVLEYELTRTGDILLSGLIKERSEAKASYGIPRVSAPRIIPVYVVSLVGVQDSLTLENSALFRSSQNVVIVLQTNDTEVQIPYFYKHRPITANGIKVGRHIIAGLVQSLGAVSEPTSHFSVVHQAVRTDYSFAFGYHPFGHFSQSEQVSKIFADAVIRNHIISRVDFAVKTLRGILRDVNTFAKDYMYNPLGKSVDYVGESVGTSDSLVSWTDQLFTKAPTRSKLHETISKLREETNKIALQLQIVAQLLAEHEFDKAYEISKSFRQSSVKLQEYVREQLSSVEMDLVCCFLDVDEEGKPTSSWLRTAFVLGGFVSLGLVILWVLLPRYDSIRAFVEQVKEKSSSNRSRGHSSLL